MPTPNRPGIWERLAEGFSRTFDSAYRRVAVSEPEPGIEPPPRDFDVGDIRVAVDPALAGSDVMAVMHESGRIDIVRNGRVIESRMPRDGYTEVIPLVPEHPDVVRRRNEAQRAEDTDRVQWSDGVRWVEVNSRQGRQPTRHPAPRNRGQREMERRANELAGLLVPNRRADAIVLGQEAGAVEGPSDVPRVIVNRVSPEVIFNQSQRSVSYSDLVCHHPADPDALSWLEDQNRRINEFIDASEVYLARQRGRQAINVHQPDGSVRRVTLPESGMEREDL